MKIRLISCIFFVFVGGWVDAQPLDNTTNSMEPVRYDGAQLWRIDYTNEKSKEIIAHLQKLFG